MTKTRHPLKVTFAEYLKTLSDEQVNARLGMDKARAWRSGELDTTRFQMPPANDRFGINEMKARDIQAFRQFNESTELK
ncbi:MAG: hypothetical protein WCR04_09160 [Fibrobacteraceae bacterium]